MAADHPVLSAPSERLLSTLNQDGSRKWIRPRLFKGRFYYGRRVCGCALIGLFALLPFVSIGGKPAILLDLVARRFTLFGATFFATDTFLLLTSVLSIFLGIFLFTALWGRLWCGWACPQTLYMEFVFRPLERWLDGPRTARRSPRRLLKYALYASISLILSHIFLAYFVGVDQLSLWVRHSPFQHPVTFGAVLVVAALIFFDFAYFREQTCLIACPYGRFQSALLDRHSLIVGYDPARGEPRGRRRRDANGTALGDCVDCRACVATCPTGIDIRDGLQMECIHCAQCVDACDTIMKRLGKPTGLVRYLSQHEVEKGKEKPFRFRILLYSLLLALTVGGFAWALLGRNDAEVSILRNDSSPWTVVGEGEIASLFRIRIRNATESPQEYTLSISGVEEAKLVCPTNPIRIAGLRQETAVVFVVLPKSAYRPGLRVTMTICDGGKFRFSKSLELAGPR